MNLEARARLTLGATLREVAAERPDAPSMMNPERCWTWKELDEEVDSLAGLLLHQGIRKGDAVGLLITKRPEVVTGFLACARIGAVVAPINFKLHPDHIRDQLRTAHITALFVEEQFDDLLRGLLPLLPDPRRILYVGHKGRHGDGWYEDLVRFPATDPGVSTHPDEVVYLNYTSGTTGRPKGAMATHRNILVNALTAFDRDGVDGLGFHDKHLFFGMFSVFSHPHELFHRSLLCGGAFVVVDTLSPRIVAENVERFAVTWMMAVPSFYEMLLDHGDNERFDLSSLTMLESGGAFVPAETLHRLEERFQAAFMPVWGSTETTGVAVAMRPDRARLPGVSGRPVAGYDVRVVDAQGRDCPPGVEGEMIVRGDAVVSAYFNAPEETLDAFRDGWYYTKDLMRWTGDGYLEFVGRRSEMLKIGGIRVYPLEIERVLLDHPEVKLAVVVRAEERIRGEIARAIVQTMEGSDLSVARLRRYCRDRLAVYKVPRIIEFWREIPRLPNGKVDKQAILAVEPDANRDTR